MKIVLASPWTGFSGTYKTTDLVYLGHGAQLCGRANVLPVDRRSAEQQARRAHLADIARHWQELSQAQRDAWQRYADRYRRVDRNGNRGRTPGQWLHNSANVVRRILGMDLAKDAPTAPPPWPLGRVVHEAGAAPDAIAIRVHHAYAVTDGCLVLLRSTAPTEKRARALDPTRFRYVCGLGPLSALPLPPSGGVLVFSPAACPVPDGRRFGVEARIVRTADGMTSPPVYGDFVK